MDDDIEEDKKELTTEELDELIKLHKDSGTAEDLFVDAKFHRG